MVQPLACVPVTDQGVGVVRAGGGPQTSMTFPLTAPPAAALLSKTLPLDQMSPVTKGLEAPWTVSDAAVPLQVPGLRVWMAAPFVPALRATAVPAAEILMVCPEPTPCIIPTAFTFATATPKLPPALPLFY